MATEAMDRETYRTVVGATVGVAANHEVLVGDRSEEYAALLDHDRKMRRLLREARELTREMAEATVKVHGHYRARCAEMAGRIYREAGFREDARKGFDHVDPPEEGDDAER